MALMLSRLYYGSRLANVPEGKVPEVADEVAPYEQVKSDAYPLKCMIGVLIAIVLGVFWMQWQMVSRMARAEAASASVQGTLTNMQGSFDDRSSGVEGRLSGVESRVGTVESGLNSVENRLGRVEGRLDSIDRERSQP